MITRIFLITLVAWGSAAGQVVGALDFSVRAALEGVFADVAVGPEGRVYLLDGRGESVIVYSGDLQRPLAVYDLKKGAAKIGRAAAIAVASDGAFWIADEGGVLTQFDPLGIPTGQLNLSGKGAYSLGRPSAMTIAPDGALVVADRSRKAIIFLDGDGVVRAHVRGTDSRGVTFDDPIDVAVDRTGYLYVIDGSGGGVCRIDSWGVLRHRWTASTSGLTPLQVPQCAACDDAGLLYVADAAGRCVVMADTSTAAMFGTLGRRPGQLQKPVAMATTSSGDLVIVDADPPRVQVFEIPGLAEVRRSIPPEDRFLAVRCSPAETWSWKASRIDVHDGGLALVGTDGKTLSVGAWKAGPESIQPIASVAGRLKTVSDVAFAHDGLVFVTDEGARAVVAVDVVHETSTPVPCPMGSWKSPHRVIRGPGDAMVIWDRGHKALAIVTGTGEASVPVNPKGEVIDLGTTPEGDIVFFFADGSPARVTSGGILETAPTAPFRRLRAALTHGEGLTAAADEGGFTGMSWSGEVRFLGGVSAAVSPLALRVIDLAADDSLIAVVTDDGRVAGFTVENAGRAGVMGDIAAPRSGSFDLHLAPLSPEGRERTVSLELGPFSLEGIVPGMYDWQIDAPGWLTLRGESPVWLKSLRVTDLGRVTMEPAGGAIGQVYPPGVSARVSAVRAGKAMATVACDETGSFTFEDIIPGEYEIAIDAPGYRAESSATRFTVDAGAVARIPPIRLIMLGSLKGYVKPMAPDQEIWLLRDGLLLTVRGPEPLDDLSDEDREPLGRFEFDDLDPGLYAIVVRTKGFYPDTSLAPVAVEQGQTVRCGTAVLTAAPPDSSAVGAVAEFDRAMEDYLQARFSVSQERMERLIAARGVPYADLSRAYELLGWCAVARGAAHGETARGAFRLALMVDPFLQASPDASPTVATVMTSVRQGLFGESGPPAGLFSP
ncbi:hypothetical protein JXA88_11290 [Candidatus Fermentibacteria bacterium]|nr:hypothetical protein [Candidatus Fermentibacteria bacterium]